MHATPELARRIDRAEIDFCALATLAGAEEAATLERGGGLAVYGAPGSPVNKMLGLGLGVEVTDEDLDEVEDFYAQRGCPVQIELCPLATPGLSARLSRRGYVLQAFENELARAMPAGPVQTPCGADTTIDVGAAEEPWIKVVAEGFAIPDRGAPTDVISSTTVTAIGEVMRQFFHPEIVRYLARVNDEPAAGGLSFVTDGVLGIFGTATQPSFRRRGLQGAIVARAINGAIGRADLVIATTEPGSTSQRTFERLGFQLLYTRAVMVKY